MGFLGYFELSAAKLANVALKTTGHLRTYDFTEFIFEVFSQTIDVRRLAANGYHDLVCSLRFPFPKNADAAAQFVSEAFRNSVLGGIDVYCSGPVLNALRDVSKTVVIAGSLFVFGEGPRLRFEGKRYLVTRSHFWAKVNDRAILSSNVD